MKREGAERARYDVARQTNADRAGRPAADLRSSLVRTTQLALQLSEEKARLELELSQSRPPGEAGRRGWRSLLGTSDLRLERIAILRRALTLSGGEERQLIREYIRRKIGRSGTFQGNYQEWMDRFDRLSADDLGAIRQAVASGELPRIGAMVDLRSLGGGSIQQLAASLKDQLYRPAVVVAVGIETLSPERADAARRALAAAASYVSIGPSDGAAVLQVEAWLLVDAAVALREHASAALACTMRHESAEVVYADEDRITPKGGRADPFFKPGYSPLLASGTDYMGDCGLVRWSRRPVPELIDLMKGANRVADLLTALAAGCSPRRVAHVPFVLFSTPNAPPRSGSAFTLRSALTRRQPAVSIIIPTRDKIDLLRACIDSIERTTSYPRDKYEIVVVDNGSQEPASIAFLDRLAVENVAVVLKDDAPFNYARLNNEAVRRSSGQILVFLNNDTEVSQADWLDRLVVHAIEHDVGAVGAKLLYPDMTVQHGGVILGMRGGASHSFTNLPQSHPGYCGLAVADHEVAAVTGACLAMRRTVFDEIGGFDENLAIAFNDTLLCIDAMRRGYRNLILESVVLLHHESKSRGVDDTAEKAMRARAECLYLWERGREFLRGDGFYNPNLSLVEPYAIASPPRRRKPWGRRRESALKVLVLTASSSPDHARIRFGVRGAAVLAQMGYDVHVGTRGAKAGMPDAVRGRHTVLASASDAAIYAARNGIDCIVSDVATYHPVARWIGDGSAVVLCGQFGWSDGIRRSERDFALRDLPAAMAHRVFDSFEALEALGICIGDQGAADASLSKAQMRHLELLRQSVRAGCGWLEHVVLLHACRTEDIDDALLVLSRLLRAVVRASGADRPALAVIIWSRGAIKAIELDGPEVKVVEMGGLQPGLNDACAAADLYLDYPRRERYALGRERALAFGIPIVGARSGAAAELADPNDHALDEMAGLLARAAEQAVQGTFTSPKTVRHLPLEHYVADLAETIDDACRRSR